MIQIKGYVFTKRHFALLFVLVAALWFSPWFEYELRGLVGLKNKKAAYETVGLNRVENELAKGTGMILFVSADWCPYSQRNEPTILRYVKSQNIKIHNLNWSNEKEPIDYSILQQHLGADAGSTPRIYAIKDGKALEYITGYESDKYIDAFFKRHKDLVIKKRY